LNRIRSKETKAVYYLLTFLIDFPISLIFVTYSLFLLSKGLDLFQISLVNAVFMLAIFLLEIPTGAFADNFGRRKSVIIGNLLFALSFLLYFKSNTMPFFIIAEIIMAIGTTFVSGALDAWMVDDLQSKKYTGKVDFVFSQATIVSRISILLGGLISAYLGKISLALPFLIAGILYFIAFFLSIYLLEEDRRKIEIPDFFGGFRQIADVAKVSVNYGIRHSVILWLTAATVVWYFATTSLNMYWTPRLNELTGNQVGVLGWMWFGMSSILLLSSILVQKLIKKNVSYLKIFIFVSLAMSLPMLYIAYSNVAIVVIIGILVHEIGRGMPDVLHKAYLNKYISSEKRATILSFNSMMGTLGSALGLLLLGLVARKYSIQASWLISGLLFLSLIFFYKKMLQSEEKYEI